MEESMFNRNDNFITITNVHGYDKVMQLVILLSMGVNKKSYLCKLIRNAFKKLFLQCDIIKRGNDDCPKFVFFLEIIKNRPLMGSKNNYRMYCLE